MASNNGSEDAPRADEGNVPPAEPEQSIWRSTWQNNKGALLILSSVICGASMDAIARFLQQGGAGFHTLEVCRFIVPRESELQVILTPQPDHHGSYGCNINSEHPLHVVDFGALLPTGSPRNTGLAGAEGAVWIHGPLHVIL